MELMPAAPVEVIAEMDCDPPNCWMRELFEHTVLNDAK